MKRIHLWLPLIAVLCACGANQPSGCLPPSEFSLANLVGTWHEVSGHEGNRDKLIIRADGTYKQITYVKDQAFDYESNWQPWRLEYGANGMPYLHLTGMRLCFYSGSCKTVGGGSGKDDIWYDDCQKQWVHMPGEGVLLVLGRPVLNRQTPQPPHIVSLVLLRKGEGSWGHEKEATPAPTVTAKPP